MIPKIALYIRVSTDEQAREGVSLEAQEGRLLAYAQSQGWTQIRLFREEGVSGKTLRRPQLQMLLNAIAKEEITMVLVYKLDRLSRNQKDLLTLVEEIFEAKKVGLRSITEPFDTTTPFGKAMLGLLAVFAQLERETIVERTKMGKRAAVQLGRWKGGPVPFAYQYKNNHLVIDLEQHQQLLTMWMWQRLGYSYQKIAERLGHISNQQRTWYTSTIHYILNNPIYHGSMRYHKELFQVGPAPILPSIPLLLCGDCHEPLKPRNKKEMMCINLECQGRTYFYTYTDICQAIRGYVPPNIASLPCSLWDDLIESITVSEQALIVKLMKPKTSC